jgi:hypothetical protein
VVDSVQGGADGVDALTAGGRPERLTLGPAHPRTGVFTVDARLDHHEKAHRRALADGDPGLLVVAELGPLAEDAAARADLARWQHLADDSMAHGSPATR